jgi:hypothetical protein
MTTSRLSGSVLFSTERNCDLFTIVSREKVKGLNLIRRRIEIGIYTTNKL